MAQVSYGTITINDLTDITDVYLEYGLAVSNATVTNNYPFNSLGEISWSTTYPTWQSGYQIWIREVQEKEGIQQKEYKTPYLDTAVNQINNNYINLNNKIKKIWSNSTGSYMASGIDNNDVNENNVSTYGYNSKSTTTGISFNYNNIPLIEMGILNSGNFSGIKLYSPVLTNSIISSNRLDATLTSWGLKLLKGGIEAGSVNAGNNGYIYLSTEDYQLKDATHNGLTINGHTPTAQGTDDKEIDDPAWRAIIGEKFGVDAEGNLYASNASIEGAITATSLTISSNGDSYNAWDAINVTGYSIEIETTEITGSTTTKKLIPHLYHNGVNIDTEVTDWTKFIWYRDTESIGITGSSTDGSIIGYYGSTYKVTYRFEDGSVGAGTEITTITVQPTDYITDINNTGIKIHPKNHNSGNYVQLDGTGMEVFEIGETDVSIAVFGANGTRIGKDDEYNVYIDTNGINMNDGADTRFQIYSGTSGSGTKSYIKTDGTSCSAQYESYVGGSGATWIGMHVGGNNNNPPSAHVQATRESGLSDVELEVNGNGKSSLINLHATSSSSSITLESHGYVYFNTANLYTDSTNFRIRLNTDTVSGTDHDLYAAITALSWQNDVIV